MASRSDRAAAHTATPQPTPVVPCPVHHDLPCRTHEMRLDDHSERLIRIADTLEKHGGRLNSGDISFVELRKDIHSLTASVDSLVGVLRWVAGIVGGAVLLAILGLVVKP